MSRYRFIDAEKAAYPVMLLCRVLGVARSGYYAWQHRGVSARTQADERLTVQSRATYGVPRVHAELQAYGVRCGSKRVARLMRMPPKHPPRIWWPVTSPHLQPIACGSEISRTCQPGRAGSPLPYSSMFTRAGSSAGR